jgi:hypothetical protein
MNKASRAGIFAVIAASGLAASPPAGGQKVGDILRGALTEALTDPLDGPHAHITGTAPLSITLHSERMPSDPKGAISLEDLAVKHYNNEFRPTLQTQRAAGFGNQARAQNPTVTPHYHAVGDQNFALRHSHLGGNLLHNEQGMDTSVSEAEFRQRTTQRGIAIEVLSDDLHCHTSLADPREATCHMHFHAAVNHIHPDTGNPQWGAGVTLEQQFKLAGKDYNVIIQGYLNPAQRQPQQQRMPQQQQPGNAPINVCREMPTAARIVCEQALGR